MPERLPIIDEIQTNKHPEDIRATSAILDSADKQKEEKQARQTTKSLGENIAREGRQIFYDDKPNSKIFNPENLIAWQQATEFLEKQAERARQTGNVKELLKVKRKLSEWLNKAADNPNVNLQQIEHAQVLKEQTTANLAIAVYEQSKNPENKLPAELLTGQPVEAREVSQQESNFMQKLTGPAKKLFAAMSFVTIFALAGCEKSEVQEKEIFKKPKYTSEEVLDIKLAIKSDPGEFLYKAKDFKDVQGLNLAQEISQAAKSSPKAFLFNAKFFKDVQGLNLAQEISQAAKSDSWTFFYEAKYFKDVQGLNLAQEISQVAKSDSWAFLQKAKYFKDVQGLNLAQEISQAGKSDPGEFLFNAKDFKDVQGLNLAQEISQAAKSAPRAFLCSAEDFKDVIPENGWSILTEKIFASYPEEGIRDYKNLLDEINEPQLKSTKILQRIANPRTAILLEKMVNNGLSEEEAVKIINDQNKFLKTLIEIKSKPDHLGKVSVDNNLKDISLKKIQQINNLHERPDSERFASVNNLTAAELYTLMTYGEEEIYTSSFNGMFSRLLGKMNQENLDGKKLLEQVGQNRFRTFIKECAGFNRLNEFLDTMDGKSVQRLLADIITNLDTAEDKLAQATAVADIFSMITDPKMLGVLQKQIKLEYERISNQPGAKQEDKIIYSILSGMFGDKAVVNEAWLKEMAEKFKLENLSELKSSDLFNRDKTNIQQYFFYDDKDGQASFNSFLSQYQNQSDWRIIKKDHFVLVTSNQNGKKMEIYANYPGSQDEGPEAIEKILKERNIETIVVVHRGHSYHASETIKRIPAIAKIVSLGSCGGYNNVEQVLKKAPKAHILSTKGTGTMLVNDPLLKNLNLEILSGKNIIWPEFWGKIEKKLGNNNDFKNYVPPHKNLGVMFLKTYHQELQK